MRSLTDAERRFGTTIYLISDEVHRRLAWSGSAFHSPLLSYPRSLSVYSFGKALALQGQRIGYVAGRMSFVRDEEDGCTLRAWVPAVPPRE